MNVLEQSISQYEMGRLTATGLMLNSLQLVNPENVGSVLGSLPTEVAEALRSFVESYNRGVRFFHAPEPSEESVRVAKEWFADHAMMKGNA